MVDLSYFKYKKRGLENSGEREHIQGEESEHSADVSKQMGKKRARITPPDQSKQVNDPIKQWKGPLPPLLEPELKVVFVGFNPGMESARTGHYYAHPSNRFWKFLFWSKLTTTLHTPFEDRKMPSLYKIGFTDLVARSTKGITQLNKEEMYAGAHQLDDRIATVSPQVVCFVGKGIWEATAKAYGWDVKKFAYGKDVYHKFGHEKSTLFCVASTSGLNSISVDKQLVAWKELYDEINDLKPLPEQGGEIVPPEAQ